MYATYVDPRVPTNLVLREPEDLKPVVVPMATKSDPDKLARRPVSPKPKARRPKRAKVSTRSCHIDPGLASEEAQDEGSRICHVCKEAAGKHSYYGGQVCASCRAFFRRSVQSK